MLQVKSYLSPKDTIQQNPITRHRRARRKRKQKGIGNNMTRTWNSERQPKQSMYSTMSGTMTKVNLGWTFFLWSELFCHIRCIGRIPSQTIFVEFYHHLGRLFIDDSWRNEFGLWHAFPFHSRTTEKNAERRRTTAAATTYRNINSPS